MLGITDEMEAALAYVAIRRSEDIPNFDDHVMPSKPFIQLRDAGMLSMTTDMGQSLVVIHGITQEGIEHYQTVLSKRRIKWPISEEADALIGAIVANEMLRKHGREDALFSEEATHDVYSTLSQNGLLNVKWADDEPYFYSVTEDGHSYVKGWFIEQLEMTKVDINNAPIFYNQGAAATSSSSATVNNVAEISLSNVISAINKVDLDDKTKSKAMAAVSELEDAAKQKDIGKFACALEKISKMIKSASELGNAILPFIGKLTQMFGS